MLPAPASTAAPPSTKSRVSWSPYVPPPPVAGAALGGWSVFPAAACAGLGEPVCGLGEPVCGLGEPAAAPFGDFDGVGEGLWPGENVVVDPAETGPVLPVQ